LLSIFQALVLGLLQGFSELFPISSLGHSVILPNLLGWNINQKDPFFLTFLVFTHLATSLVLLGFFWQDWKRIISGIFRSLLSREIKSSDHDAKLGWLLVIATVPAGVLGLLFEDFFKTFFAVPKYAAFFLALNGLLLFGAEILRKRQKEQTSVERSDERIAKLSFIKALKVGMIQPIALLPGFSRTGATIAGGLFVGLSHEDAARFSFLLATPIIGAAALLKLPELIFTNNQNIGLPIVVGGFASAFSAYFSIKFLVRYFQFNTLLPFAIYCLVFGLGVFLYFLSR